VTRAHPEDDLQMQAADYLNLLPSIGYFGWHHVPNGGKRDPREAGRFQRMGVKAGYPDIRIDRPASSAPIGAAIELKAGKARASDAQQDWHAALYIYGVRTALCRSLDEVIAALKKWGYVR